MKEELVVRTDIESSVWAFLSSTCISEQYPDKALVDIVGTSILGHLLTRLKQSKLIEQIALCTTTNAEDDAVTQLAQQHNVDHYRGPAKNAIQSILDALECNDIDIVVLVNDSNILIDPDYIDKAIYHHFNTNSEHTDIRALPRGMAIDVVDVDLLKSILVTSFNSSSISTLSNIFHENRGQYQTATTPVDKPHAKNWRLSLETPEDLSIVRPFLHAMDTSGLLFNYRINHVIEFFNSNPDWLDTMPTES
jgi:spore coat polysaccharide biosynthesis protein SpsF (cytidylyltransferase family)